MHQASRYRVQKRSKMGENNEFGSLLKTLRLQAGYGLRRFAELIGERPSNLSAVERGNRAPWRGIEKLRSVADALALSEGSLEWDRFFLAAQRIGTLPDDIERLIHNEVNLALLRAVDDMKLTDDEVKALVEELRSRRRPKRGSKTRRAR